jgi:Cu+-exporting ATPase
MQVDPHTTKHRAEHAGRAYFFCSARCREKFLAEPARYLGVAVAEAVPLPAGTIYTCPMHPEVRQIGPGHCPKCGMALEPLMPGADSEDDGGLRTLARRFGISLVLTIPVVAVAMGPHLFGWHLPASGDRIAAWIQAVLGTVVVLWAGAPFFARGWRSLKPWSPNMYTLIALGTGVAWLYSAVAFAAPGVFPPAFRDPGGRVGVYFESAAVIVTLVLLGDFLELRGLACTDGSGAKDRAPHRCRWQRARPAAGRRACRRQAARAPRREGADRRRGARRREPCR